MKLATYLIAALLWAIIILLAPVAIFMLCLELVQRKLTGRRMP